LEVLAGGVALGTKVGGDGLVDFSDDAEDGAEEGPEGGADVAAAVVFARGLEVVLADVEIQGEVSQEHTFEYSSPHTSRT